MKGFLAVLLILVALAAAETDEFRMHCDAGDLEYCLP